MTTCSLLLTAHSIVIDAVLLTAMTQILFMVLWHSLRHGDFFLIDLSFQRTMTRRLPIATSDHQIVMECPTAPPVTMEQNHHQW